MLKHKTSIILIIVTIIMIATIISVSLTRKQQTIDNTAWEKAIASTEITNNQKIVTIQLSDIENKKEFLTDIAFIDDDVVKIITNIPVKALKWDHPADNNETEIYIEYKKILGFNSPTERKYQEAVLYLSDESIEELSDKSTLYIHTLE